MKNHLRRCLTDYDQQGKLNKSTIAGLRFAIHQNQIQEASSINDFNLNRFRLQQLDLTFASTPAISKHPFFLAIVKIVREYNEEVDAFGKQGKQESPQMHAKKEIMDTTMNLLRTVMLSPSVEAKISILQKTHSWLVDQLNPKTNRKSKAELFQKAKDSCRKREVQLLMEREVDLNYPSQQSQAQLDHYLNKARTHHRDRDAPRFQLQEYIARRINIKAYLKKGLEDSAKGVAGNKLARVAFKSKDWDHLGQETANSRQEQRKTLQRDKITYQQTIETRNNQEEPASINLNHEAQTLGSATQENQTLIPQTFNQTSSLDLENNNNINSISEEIQDSVPKRQGELDPKTKAYPYRVAQISDRQPTLPIPILLRQKNVHHSRQKVHREDDFIARRVELWAGSRSKFKTDLARKIESSRVFFQQGGTSQERTDKWYKLKINSAIRQGRLCVGSERSDSSMQKGTIEPGLSIYSRERQRVASTRSAKTLESILREHSRSSTLDSGLEEVQELKDKLTKKNVYASLAALKNSMMGPEEGQEMILTSRLERPLGLISNPLLKRKRKKRIA